MRIEDQLRAYSEDVLEHVSSAPAVAAPAHGWYNAIAAVALVIALGLVPLVASRVLSPGSAGSDAAADPVAPDPVLPDGEFTLAGTRFDVVQPSEPATFVAVLIGNTGRDMDDLAELIAEAGGLAYLPRTSSPILLEEDLLIPRHTMIACALSDASARYGDLPLVAVGWGRGGGDLAWWFGTNGADTDPTECTSRDEPVLAGIVFLNGVTDLEVHHRCLAFPMTDTARWNPTRHAVPQPPLDARFVFADVVDGDCMHDVAPNYFEAIGQDGTITYAGPISITDLIATDVPEVLEAVVGAAGLDR